MPPWCSGSRHCSSGSAPDTYWCECGGVCCVLATSEFGVLFVSAFAMSHPSRTFSPRLSKSRYTAGTQCQKLLWWKAHEPLAVELQPDKVLQDRFDQGSQVGALARDRFPGGLLIDLPHNAYKERIELTRKLIDDGAPAIFEASFLADNTFVAVDVLTAQGGGYHLTEVKSSSSQKE